MLARPRRHHDHAVGQEDRLLDVVGHEQRGGGHPLVDAQELEVQALARELVDGGERLVEQQHVHAHHQEAGERHALLHAAGEVARIGVLEAAQPDEVEQLVGLALGALVELLAELGGKQRVLERGLPGQQRRALEHQRHVLARRGHRAAVDGNCSRAERDQAGDQPQHRRLAAAAGTDDRDELAWLGQEVDVVEREHTALELLGHALGDDRAVAAAARWGSGARSWLRERATMVVQAESSSAQPSRIHGTCKRLRQSCAG